MKKPLRKLCGDFHEETEEVLGFNYSLIAPEVGINLDVKKFLF
jgi:hypothetical protein